MSKQVEFFFDVGSPTAYLAWTQLPKIADRQGAEIVWRPMLLGGVFKATGNQSPVMIPAKGKYLGPDLQRFAERYGITLNQNPHFPINTVSLMRGACGYQAAGQLDAYLGVVFPAMWVERRNLNDPAEVLDMLKQNGFDPEEFQKMISDDAVKGPLKEASDEAVSRGTFGAPTFFVGDEMFFGQDRLDFVEEALQKQ